MDVHGWKRGFAVTALFGLGVVALLYALPARGEVALAGLEEADPQAREEAIGGLATTASMDDLLYALGDEHTPLARAGIAEAIRRKGVTAAEADDLVLLLAAKDVTTRHLAAVLLEPVATSVWTSLRDTAANGKEVALVRTAAARALGSAGAQARSTLQGLTGAGVEPRSLRYAAFRSLACVSADGTADVTKIAADPRRAGPDREAAIHALTDPRCAGESALVSLCGDRVAAVRREAAHALRVRGATGASTTLASLLTDADGGVRHAALQAIDGLGLAKTNRLAVVGRLLDLDPRVTALAARVVGQISAASPATVTPTLRGLLASTSFRVRHEAALALNRLGDKSGAATMRADQNSTNASQSLQAAQAYAVIVGI